MMQSALCSYKPLTLGQWAMREFSWITPEAMAEMGLEELVATHSRLGAVCSLMAAGDPIEYSAVQARIEALDAILLNHIHRSAAR